MRPTLVALALSIGLSTAAFGQDETPVIIPSDAPLAIGLDARALYEDATFDAIMTLVEASSSYQEQADQLEAWGFDPRADVHQVVFATDRFGEPDAQFVLVVAGDISAAEMRTRMAEWPHLRREARDHGDVWVDARGTHYALTDTIAVAGVGEMFEHAYAAIASGATVADRSRGTIWMDVRPQDEAAAAHPSLATLNNANVSLELDSTPSIHVEARLETVEQAEAGAEEFRRLLRSAADVPELSVFGLDDAVRSASITVTGATVSLSAEFSADDWAVVSTRLSDMIAEELR